MAEWDKPRILLVGGPTATGKTALAAALAKRLGGEIISADSMQVYQGLSIGTAKATPEEMQGVRNNGKAQRRCAAGRSAGVDGDIQ